MMGKLEGYLNEDTSSITAWALPRTPQLAHPSVVI